MAQFLVSTTSSSVFLLDLGTTIVHPTVNRDLSSEFSQDDLTNSKNLSDAIQDGYLTLKLSSQDYGLIEVEATQYNPYSLLEQLLPSNEKEIFITEVELKSKYLETAIVEDTFPYQLSSTTAVTNILTSVNAKFQGWGADEGDVVGIFGTGITDGYFDIIEIISQKQLRTLQPLSTTNSVGTFSIFHKSGASRVGVNPNNFSLLTGSTAQALFEEIDFELSSISPGAHDDLETLVHELAESFDGYETRNSDGVLTQVEFKNPLNGNLIRKANNFVCNSDGLVTGFEVRQYNNSGTVVQTLSVTVDPITGTHYVVET